MDKKCDVEGCAKDAVRYDDPPGTWSCGDHPPDPNGCPALKDDRLIDTEKALEERVKDMENKVIVIQATLNKMTGVPQEITDFLLRGLK